MTDQGDQLPAPGDEPGFEPGENERVIGLLSRAALWAEPSADLEDRVLGALRQRMGTAEPAAPAGPADAPVAPVRPTGPPPGPHLTAVPDLGAPEAPAQPGPVPQSDLAQPAPDWAPQPGPATQPGAADQPGPDATAPGVLIRPARWQQRWRPVVVGAAAGALVAAALLLAVQFAGRPTPNLRTDLVTTGVYPAAAGTAALRETSSGWEIQLDTTGLPRLDNGRFYEAWLEGPKGLVSVGTFHTGADVTLWAGVEADEYDSLSVMIQQENGNPAPSLERVLVARLKP